MNRFSRSNLLIGLPLVSWHLLPLLTELQRSHPELNLDLRFDNRKVDMLAEGFDAAIRTGDVEDPRMNSRELGSFRVYVVGSPDYFSNRGRPMHPRELIDHDCILYQMPQSGRLQKWPIQLDDGERLPELSPRLTCNNDAARLHFALHGLGLTCMSEFSVQEHLEAGRLETVLEPFTRFRYTYRLVWPRDKPITPALQTFLDVATQGLSSPIVAIGK